MHVFVGVPTPLSTQCWKHFPYPRLRAPLILFLRRGPRHRHGLGNSLLQWALLKCPPGQCSAVNGKTCIPCLWHIWTFPCKSAFLGGECECPEQSRVCERLRVHRRHDHWAHALRRGPPGGQGQLSGRLRWEKAKIDDPAILVFRWAPYNSVFRN